MKRREFIAVTAAVLVSPHSLWAQRKPRHIGFLAIGDGSGQALNQAERVFLDGLRHHGWLGGNLIVELRFSHPPDQLPASVADLIGLNPDVLIAAGPQAALALKSATATIPIVFVAVADPVRLGLVQSLSRPGGNITGITTNVPEDFFGKRIEILRELIPGASRIAILVNPKNPMLYLVEETRSKARKLGIVLLTVEAATAEELDVAFASASAQNADAIIDFGDPLTYVEAPRIIALAAKYRLPANYLFRVYANGGLSVYGADTADLFRRASSFVDRILRGTKPADLPVEQPTKFELVINIRIAKALGLTVPSSILVRADEVIE
ncbi:MULTISPECIES: ABC transporter substrate-binding protein [unclassified Bradyrhizobium]|uniref:ABC transporter substrate-binding protein n=1 Tax=unclassified Bradyrhizobium TaxID=2631580 RepID=UPI001FF6B7B5|nr:MULTISPECIES: ABC transporter substrate-binding protein [unclassified Bradyrhizobium]MCJ9704999.1 ABC transporter substrate-binding protein [Bradyrhizobium sp. SHOUNA76]MCJ9731984.1 ABC transporter substrate-binding protein [Bradyrhizobium sp. PRIMUS42]